jgi:hypothetical protein
LLCIAFIASKPKINVCKISKWVYVWIGGRLLLRHLPLCPQHNQVRENIPNQCFFIKVIVLPPAPTLNAYVVNTTR